MNSRARPTVAADPAPLEEYELRGIFIRLTIRAWRRLRDGQDSPSGQGPVARARLRRPGCEGLVAVPRLPQPPKGFRRLR
ncbi:hypothetical protein GCM10010052_32000 [Paenarthrobacter histidinolovorans]|nr:hypothetical protein GCM10010052_32000 [Paenarthrobacter histidinolovorans]